jgi:two-component sensor histidine kinase
MPSVANISTLRRVVDNLTFQVTADEDLSWRLSMATHELLENSVKYGEGGAAHLSFEVEALPQGAAATVMVRNLATTDQVACLLTFWEGMRRWSDGWAFYMAAMARAAARTEGSGVGLARIWAEGGMPVTVSVDDERHVTISARMATEERA